MLMPYRRVLAHAGARSFFLTGLLARAPMAMIGLGIVLLVEGVRGSYALAGLVTAAFVLSEGALALVQGRLLDRFGQAAVLVPATVVSNLSLVGLVVATTSGAPLALLLVLAALGGATFPQVGSAVRARWSFLLADRTAEKDTAYALEGVADESAFVVGPVLVTVLATTVHPTAGLLTAAVVALVGTLGFSRLRATQPPVRLTDDSVGPVAPLAWRSLLPATGVAIGLGVLFGGMEVATVAFADERANQSAAGLLLALWAGASLVAGVATGLVSWTVDAATRMRRFTAAFALVVLPLPFVPTLTLMAGLLLLVGLAVAPTLIAMVSAVEAGAPRDRLTESLAVAHTGLAVGVASGAALAGLVVEELGVSAAYAVPVVAMALGALAAQVSRQAGSPGRVAGSLPDTPISPRVGATFAPPADQ
ncbi:MFS transporter [Nocardioidaceae bacterium]|nr:MFS transporter [Nocardioidaceae bacterium]